MGALAKSWLLFLGPLAPRAVTNLPTPYCFLTLGLFNFLVVATNNDERRAAKILATSSKVPFEEWELASGKLRKVHLSSPRTKTTHRVRPIRGQDPALHEAIREYTSVLATSLARSTQFAPQFGPDLERFDVQLRTAVLADPDSTVADRQRLLVLTNAALSRHSSQTFAGTTPLVETECHFWTHSLLGVGTASLALLRVRQFLEASLSRGRLVDRLLQLANELAHPVELEHLPATDPFWDKDHLFEYPSQATIPGVDVPGPSDVLPLITCFSGRDGFRSTPVSLSAPLEVISCSNTSEWALLTLTHESSHNVIYALLGQLLPKALSVSHLKLLVGYLNSGQYPNLLAQLRAFTCFGFWRLRNMTHESFDAEELRDTIIKHWPSVNEILTHCFDFLYFYRRDPARYIPAVWASWGVVPNIRTRVSAYVVRCLCAIHTRNIAREDGVSVSLDALALELQQARKLFPNAPYIPDALEDLSARRTFYKNELGRHSIFVKLARYFFYSRSVEAKIFEDSSLTAGGREGYPFVPLEMGPEQVENPLRFVAAYSRDKRPDAARSLWMLYQIAFGRESW